MFFTDTHAHIHSEPLINDINGVLDRAEKANIKRIITIGTDLSDSKQAVALAEKHDNIFATVGVHPEYTSVYLNDNNYNDNNEELLKLSQNEKVVAIGEVGLDYYKEHDPEDRQQELFRLMLDISLEVKKPVVIHNREASIDCIKIMQEKLSRTTYGGIFHCFSGGADIIKWALDNNFYCSYAGQTTFKSAQNIRDTLKIIPRDRIFIETDCPYLSPVPLRGKQNEPAHMVHTAELVANELNITIEELAEQLEANFQTLFKKAKDNA